VRATALEFKFRLWISFTIIGLGFAAPWIEWLHWGDRTTHTWGWLAWKLSHLGISSIIGFEIVTALAVAAAAIAAALRVWGTAYLGTATVFNAEMKAGAENKSGQVLADGPYRFMRNPLYVGSFLSIVALAILMPPSGAVVSLLLLAVFLLRLILGEEAFLKPQLGAPYATYLRAVPRILPSLRPRVPAGGQTPRWGLALVGELFPLGVFLSFAALSWQYDSGMLIRAVLISFGISLVARALIVPKPGSLRATA
jgi:protein-S-isoprenylcysteine O-methyltransferase Ste14